MEKQRIEAYTLMEVAVAMLLAAICISICYTAYGLIGDYFNAFEKKNSSEQTALSLRHAMNTDIGKCGYLIRIEDGIEAHQDSLLVRYHFGAAAVSREISGLRTDSFKLVASDIGFGFEGHDALAGDTLDRLSFVLSLEKGVKVPLLFKKAYSAQDLFK